MTDERIDIRSLKTWEEKVDLITKRIGANNPPSFNQNKFKKWLLEKKNCDYFFDEQLFYRAWKVYNKIRQDLDNFTVIAGKEGYGKSWLGIDFCSLISPEFNIPHVVFTPQEYISVLRNAQPYSSVQIDEGGQLMFTRESMNMMNKLLAKCFMIQRQKNLNVIICVPNFFMVDSMIRNHRVDILLQIKKRGYYRGIIESGIRKVSKDGYKFQDVMGTRVREDCFWDGHWNKLLPNNFDYDKYISVKKNHMSLFLDQAEEDVMDIKLVPAIRVAKEISVHPRTIRNLIEKGEVEGKKIGERWFVSRKAYLKLVNT